MWGFHLLLHFCLFLIVCLCLVSCLFCLSIPVPSQCCSVCSCLYPSVPLSLHLSVFLPNLLTCKPQTLHPNYVPPFPFPQPLVPQPPPASLCCIAHCLVREQGVMFMGRGGGSSRAWGDGGQGRGLRVGSVGKASTVPHLRSSHNDPPPCQGSCRR